MNTIRIGCGAGYSGDRIEPAIELATHGRLDYLVFECLAERTIALAQQARRTDPGSGYDPLLVDRMRAVLHETHRRDVRIITNMGAANPHAAAAAVASVAREMGLHGMRIAAVTGDDVLPYVAENGSLPLDSGATVSTLSDVLVSANAYLGATPIVEALGAGAHVVVTGRVADPALFLAPLVYQFGWAIDDWTRLGAGILAGHLLECAGQVTGGYFADPGRKDVQDLARLGFPLAEVDEQGAIIVTKAPGSGGLVTAATCKEQLLYEVHDPAAYTTPDVVADFSQVTVAEVAPDRVSVLGARGRAAPATLKVSLGYVDGFIGDGQISYGGPGAVSRARLAVDIVRQRLSIAGVQVEELQTDLIGIDSLYGARTDNQPEPWEVRLRVAGRTATMADAIRIGQEVEALYTNGPAGGGGATRSAREVIAIASTFVPRCAVATRVTFEDVP